MSTGRPRFEVHKAQKIAAALLLIFLLQALWLVAHLPLSLSETRNVMAGKSLWTPHKLQGTRSPMIPGDSILTLRCVGLLPAIAQHWQTGRYEFSVYEAPNRWLVRLPFVAFGMWLGGALWWVARRLFADEGGYVALGLYCFSPPILLASCTAEPAILASWGLFGLVFTAIGVAHTLYAPSEKWRPRIVLLGVAIGLTAAASVSAVVVGMVLAAAFMLYLAPGRRLASLAILAVSTAIGLLVFLICFGFNTRDLTAASLLPDAEYLRFTAYRLREFMAVPGGALEIVALLAALCVFLLWKRTRYFGNVAPLLVALILPWWPGDFSPSASIQWTLPFAFVFVGGIYADLLERRFFQGRFRKHVAMTSVVLIGASAVLSLILIMHAS